MELFHLQRFSESIYNVKTFFVLHAPRSHFFIISEIAIQNSETRFDF